MDGQFESSRGDLEDMQVTLNLVSRAEHVAERRGKIHPYQQRVGMLCVQYTSISANAGKDG
jgi:hypothetical protein